jgi:hypothetical protein
MVSIAQGTTPAKPVETNRPVQDMALLLDRMLGPDKAPAAKSAPAAAPADAPLQQKASTDQTQTAPQILNPPSTGAPKTATLPLSASAPAMPAPASASEKRTFVEPGKGKVESKAGSMPSSGGTDQRPMPPNSQWWNTLGDLSALSPLNWVATAGVLPEPGTAPAGALL